MYRNPNSCGCLPIQVWELALALSEQTWESRLASASARWLESRVEIGRQRRPRPHQGGADLNPGRLRTRKMPAPPTMCRNPNSCGCHSTQVWELGLALLPASALSEQTWELAWRLASA